jgi:hypothetical protein
VDIDWMASASPIAGNEMREFGMNCWSWTVITVAAPPQDISSTLWQKYFRRLVQKVENIPRFERPKFATF